MRFPISMLPLLALGACTVGPDYAGPPAVGTAGQPPATFARAGDHTTSDAPAVGAWWTTLGDPLLDRLEASALAANPNVAVAQARVRQARASARMEGANALPSANAQATYVHARVPGLDLTGGNPGSGGGTQAFDFYNVGFDASWEVDLFGGQRRKQEAARANLEAAVANVADAQVSLSAEVAKAYVALRDAQMRQRLASEAAAKQRETLALMQQRYDRGAVSALQVDPLRGQVEEANAKLVPLAAEIDSYKNALAVLTGQEPGALDAMLDAPAPVPLPPASVAIGDPAALLQRRPDIRAAERQLAARTAQVGVAEAARFPHLSFMGILGIGGTDPGDLTRLGDFAAIAMPRLQWNFLDFGRNKARVEQSEGVRDEAEAQYRGAVLAALRDAEDSLSRFAHRRETVASLARSKATAEHSLGLIRQRYQAGASTRSDVLDAERQLLAAEQALTSGTAALTQDYVALQKALGLGWAPPTDGATQPAR